MPSTATCKQRITPPSHNHHRHHHHIPHNSHHPTSTEQQTISHLSVSATPDLSRYPCTFPIAITRVPHPSSVQPSTSVAHNSQSRAAFRHKPGHLLRTLLMWGFFLGLTANLQFAAGCGPGHGPPSPHPPRVVLKPLAIWERVPPMSELTYGASGPVEGPIRRNTDKFQKLKVNENSKISFDSDDARRMNLKCQNLLNYLADWTALRWGKDEGRLRVKHGWRPLNQHDDLNEEHRLHYEGRAIDITMNSPSESANMGYLAAMAVLSGFDYVHYRGDLVHCSCVSEQYSTVYPKGCFSGNSLVTMSDGTTRPVSDLVPGDHVLSFDHHGNVHDDIFLTFLDQQSEDGAKVISIVTEDGRNIRLTPNHLIFIHDDVIVAHDNTTTELKSGMARFAGRARVGQYLYSVEGSSGRLAPSKIVTVSETIASDGLYAPMTYSGRILVEQVAASCYAVVECETCAHYVLHPVRLYYYIKHRFLTSSSETTSNNTRAPSIGSNSDHVTRYMRFLQHVASWVMPDKLLWASQL